MSQQFRLSNGGQIDRGRAISFTFDGKSYIGYEGDTLASALLANGVHLVGRSFKYHRPRGVTSAFAIFRRRTPSLNSASILSLSASGGIRKVR